MEAALAEGVMEEEGGLRLEETERWSNYNGSMLVEDMRGKQK